MQTKRNVGYCRATEGVLGVALLQEESEVVLERRLPTARLVDSLFLRFRSRSALPDQDGSRSCEGAIMNNYYHLREDCFGTSLGSCSLLFLRVDSEMHFC